MRWLGGLRRSLGGDGVKSTLARLAIPIFLEVLLVMMLGAVDTFMLSRHSDGSVAAVGLVNQIVMFCFLVFEVINLGTSVLCSQYIGAGLNAKVEKVVGVSLIVNLVLGFAISAFLYFGDETVLGWMGLAPELMPDGSSYLRIVGAFAFFQALSMTLSAALRSADKAVYPMLVTLVINILNIVGNYSLIFGRFGFPALGVTGAAISTATCRGVAMVLLFIVVRKKLIPHFHAQNFRPFPWRELKKLMQIGLPSAGEQASYSSSQIVITYFINMLGVDALATRTYCVNMIMFVYLFCISIAQGGAICIGHYVGRGRTRAAFLLGKYVMKKSVGYTLCFSVLLALAGPYIFGVLTDNPTIRHLGCAILWIDVALEIGRPINIFATNALRAAGDVNYPFYVGLIVMWSVAVAGGYIAGVWAGMGILGMWAAFTLDENIRGAIFVRRWWSMKWSAKSFVTR
ncbi:MAG: MATE family efflux transporter [Bacteroidales bacterium]|nr:MATE family efflux transporter [Bacteroidales bacterium]